MKPYFSQFNYYSFQFFVCSEREKPQNFTAIIEANCQSSLGTRMYRRCILRAVNFRYF